MLVRRRGLTYPGGTRIPISHVTETTNGGQTMKFTWNTIHRIETVAVAVTLVLIAVAFVVSKL